MEPLYGPGKVWDAAGRYWTTEMCRRHREYLTPAGDCLACEGEAYDAEAYENEAHTEDEA